MTTYEIDSIGHDADGRYYALEDDAPLTGLMVDEAEMEVEIFYQQWQTELRDLFALLRDIRLGFDESDLHMDPDEAMKNTLELLEAVGYRTDDLLSDADRRILGMEIES